MKLKNKIKLGAAAIVGGAVAGIALNKVLDQMVKTHLSRDGITHPKQKLIARRRSVEFLKLLLTRHISLLSKRKRLKSRKKKLPLLKKPLKSAKKSVLANKLRL